MTDDTATAPVTNAITIDVAYPSDAIFAGISSFAKDTYLKRWNTKIDPHPDAFAYATREGVLIGCAAFTRASDAKKLPLEVDHLPDAILRMSDGVSLPRPLFAETGTRAVEKAEVFGPKFGLDPKEARRLDGTISIALIAQSINLGDVLGVKHICFTANRRLVRGIILAFDGKVKHLGAPDDSTKSVAHRENWKAYMELGRDCFSFEVEPHRLACQKMIGSLKSQGFVFKAPRGSPGE